MSADPGLIAVSVTVASGTDFVFACPNEAASLAKFEIPASFSGTTITIKPWSAGLGAVQEYDSTNTLVAEQGPITVAASRRYRLSPQQSATIGPRVTLTSNATETSKTVVAWFRVYN